MARILIPLPRFDHDPSEAAIPWQQLQARGHQVRFATPDGRAAQADPRMLHGTGLGPWKPLLQADARARAAHAELRAQAAFQQPLRWDAVQPADFDALLLPGGHAPGMREYLESPRLQALVAGAMDARQPVAAICHGVVLLARSRAGLLHGHRVTALLARQELLAWGLTAAWLGRYYRTYPQTVQAEVTAALAARAHFIEGPPPLLRDAPGRESRGFCVRSGKLVTARWPGDAHRFAAEFASVLQ